MINICTFCKKPQSVPSVLIRPPLSLPPTHVLVIKSLENIHLGETMDLYKWNSFVALEHKLAIECDGVA